MFSYTPELVAELVERRFEASDELATVELFADLDTALHMLSIAHPGAYRLVCAYAKGYRPDELGDALGLTADLVSEALSLIFDHLARRLNDDPS
jgi:DNA-directed RNA polymerase specialized sigma24 family protein